MTSQNHHGASDVQNIQGTWPSTSTTFGGVPVPLDQTGHRFSPSVPCPTCFAPQECNNYHNHAESQDNLVGLGMMMTGESGMDEQWMSFMRDSGLLGGTK